MAWITKWQALGQYLRAFAKWVLLGGLMGVLGGLLGLVGLFCCVTNSPFASIVLSVELFGSGNIHLFALVCVICFVLSGKTSLYFSQIIQFSTASTMLDEETEKDS